MPIPRRERGGALLDEACGDLDASDVLSVEEPKIEEGHAISKHVNAVAQTDALQAVILGEPKAVSSSNARQGQR